MPEEIDPCSIPTLAAEGAAAGLIPTDKIDYQALKVYLLALALRGLGGTNYTDICSLAKSLQPYDGLPDYSRRAASLMAYGYLAEASGAEEIAAVQAKAAIACAHCCGITKISLESAETVLFCLIADLITPE